MQVLKRQSILLGPDTVLKQCFTASWRRSRQMMLQKQSSFLQNCCLCSKKLASIASQMILAPDCPKQVSCSCEVLDIDEESCNKASSSLQMELRRAMHYAQVL